MIYDNKVAMLANSKFLKRKVKHTWNITAVHKPDIIDSEAPMERGDEDEREKEEDDESPRGTNPIQMYTINSKTTDYVGNKIYLNGQLDKILLPNGYIKNGVYFYYIKDHISNNRVVIKDDNIVVQRVDYYMGSGLPIQGGLNPEEQNRKYGDLEFDTMHGLNQSDVFNRFVMNDLVRTTTPDPHAENYYAWSPYSWCGDNLVKYIDPDGQDIWEINEFARIINRIPDKTQDAFYMVEEAAPDVWVRTYTNDDMGNEVHNSISFEHGTVTSVNHPTPRVRGTPTRLTTFEVKGDNNASQLFEFFANPGSTTNVEWTHAKIGTQNSGSNIVGTSHEPSSTAVGHYLRETNYTLKEVNHNHPSGSPLPSGRVLPDGTGYGDLYGATQYNSSVKLNIYTTKYRYSPYNSSGTLDTRFVFRDGRWIYNP